MQEMRLIDAYALKDKWLHSDHKGTFVDFIDNAPSIPAVPLEAHEKMKRELNEDKHALIAGQETLQKALAEKIAEIESLDAENTILVKELDKKCDECIEFNNGQARAEAIKEFAERLYKFFCDKQNWNDFRREWLENGECYWLKQKLDNLVKEMTDKESSNAINSDSRQTEINNNTHSLVRSFVERLKYQLSLGLENKIPANVYSFVYCTVDNLAKEMAGEG